MKLLTTEQQTELRDIFLSIFNHHVLPSDDMLEKWVEELRPKKTRRPKNFTTIENNT